MEAPETTKPDLVFDGELNFEKGVSSVYTLSSLCDHPSNTYVPVRTPHQEVEKVINSICVTKCIHVSLFSSHICRSCFFATRIYTRSLF